MVCALECVDLEEKFLLNAKHGGWTDARAAPALKLIVGLFDGAVGLSPLTQCSPCRRLSFAGA